MKKKVALLIFVLIFLMSSTMGVFAAKDPSVNIVNPKQVVIGDNFLISVKLTAPKKIRVCLYEKMQIVNKKPVSINPYTIDVNKVNKKNIQNVIIGKPQIYESSASLSFYSRKISKITPGLYLLTVETLDSNNKPTHSSEHLFFIIPKGTNQKGFIEEATKWKQSVLKKNFGS